MFCHHRRKCTCVNVHMYNQTALKLCEMRHFANASYDLVNSMQAVITG